MQEALEIHILNDQNAIPYTLLKLADPSTEQINKYLKTGTCYVAKMGNQIIGTMILNKTEPNMLEIKNIAVDETFQNRGFGAQMIRKAIEIGKEKGMQKMQIGTGNSSIGQLKLYQKMGFEMVDIIKDFFVDQYAETIMENGIQCKHMVRLEMDLT